MDVRAWTFRLTVSIRLRTTASGRRVWAASADKHPAMSAASERATGYVIGGISPLGTRRPLPVVIDTSGLAFDTIFISAGRRGLQLELAGADLVRLAGATVAVIVRDHRPG